MNLNENIIRIKTLMTENSQGIVNLVRDIGLYDAITYFGGYDNVKSKIGDYKFSTEEMIQFIKQAVKNLCDKYDDVEVASYNLNGVQIVYDETDTENQVIEYYSPEHITVERYTTDDEDYDVFSEDDFYIGAFQKTYEQLHPSLITEIFYLMIEEM